MPQTINFPNSFDDDQSLYLVVNNLRTRLTSNISDSDTTIPVVSTAGYPEVGFITILTGGNIVNSEAIAYSGTDATNFFNCERGTDGTTAFEHQINDFVDHTIVSRHHNNLKNAIIELERFVGVSGSENFVPFIDGNVVLPGTLSVQGTLAVSGGATFAFVTVANDLDVQDDLTVSGSLQVGNGPFVTTVDATTVETTQFLGNAISITDTAHVEDLTASGVTNLNDVIVTGTLTATTGSFSDSLTVSGIPVDIAGIDIFSLVVRETDGSPAVSGVNTIVVTTGTLTDNGGGQVTINTGGGGSFDLTVREEDGSPSVSNVNTIVVSNSTLTDDGGGQVTITTGGGGGGSSAGPFYATFATVSGATQSLSNNTLTFITITDDERGTNTGGFTSDNGAITVPVGSGYTHARLIGQITYAISASGTRDARILMNKQAPMVDYQTGEQVPAPISRLSASASGQTLIQVSSPIVAISGGTQFDLQGFQNSGGSLDVQGGITGTFTFLTIEAYKQQ